MTSVRVSWLDVLRGVAMLWMAGFHLCFDLNQQGLWNPRQHFGQDPFWSMQRLCIVSLFLVCAGMGQALAWGNGQAAGAFWRRWAMVAGCALLVSLSSWWMFPRSWIYFGVLHGMAVMLALLHWAGPRLAGLNRADCQRPAATTQPPPAQVQASALAIGALRIGALGLLALSLPWAFRHEFFNHPAWHWTGLVTRLPVTEDFVPLLPWLGPMLLGYALGLWAFRALQLRSAPLQLLPQWLKPLATLGRWPLSFYMLHQPVWLGLIQLGLALGWLHHNPGSAPPGF